MTVPVCAYERRASPVSIAVFDLGDNGNDTTPTTCHYPWAEEETAEAAAEEVDLEMGESRRRKDPSLASTRATKTKFLRLGVMMDGQDEDSNNIVIDSPPPALPLTFLDQISCHSKTSTTSSASSTSTTSSSSGSSTSETDYESSSSSLSSSSDHSDSSYSTIDTRHHCHYKHNSKIGSSSKKKSVSFAPSNKKKNNTSKNGSTTHNRWSSCIASFKNKFPASPSLSSPSRHREKRKESQHKQLEQLEQVYYIPNRHELLMDIASKSELWYTSRDYRMMKDSTEQVVALLSSGVLQAAQAAQSYLVKRGQQLQQQIQATKQKQEEDDEDEGHEETLESTSSSSSNNISNMICIQGLEGSYGIEKEERSRLRRRGVLTVLLEQDMQIQDGYQCDELLAEMYKDFSIKAQHAACQRANDLVIDLNH
mmetsp:Transcript_918/g.2032  ORF Transcript_918/g.2032 Transcript_918/m.2032 type:complete len:424 (+) Transcript_918:260-1531(+)